MAIKQLAEMPSLNSLYPKAVLGRFGSSKGEPILPDAEYVVSGVEPNSAELAAYNEVCGYRLTNELPATYPHVLAFPLQMALLTDKTFPFPLLGMVHVANRITYRRPLTLDESVTVSVRAENLRPHDKGTQFDVVSELTSETKPGGQSPVWTEVSTYLHRHGETAKRDKSAEVDSPSPPTPQALWRVPADTGRRYAKVSGDRNPIHLHPLTARLFGFPATIAHGMWTKARCLAYFEGQLPDSYTVSVKFAKPVLLPAKTAFSVQQKEDGWTFELQHATKSQPHLFGEILV